MDEILARKIPKNLDELRIENCKTEPSVIEKLVKMILNRSYLKRLALVNASLNPEAFNMLIELVQHSGYLIELDLSYNLMRPV